MRARSTIALGVSMALMVVGCGGGARSATSDSAPRASGTTSTVVVADTPGPASSASTSTSTSSTTSTTIAPGPTLYAPPPGEPEADLKSAAARFLETLTTFGPGGAQEASSGARLADAGYDPSLAMQAPLLLAGAEESVGEIVYPQLGGLTGDQASVMAVLRLRRRTSSGTTETVVRTVDVRLERRGDWKVTGVASDGGTAPVAARPNGLAAEVLQSPRLEMSDSARWDVAVGRIDRRILQLVLDLSATKSLSITVFASGHPTNVFGESSVSNHTRGRGVDIWAVDGKPVAGSQPDGPAHEVAASAMAAGATELGAPWDLDGPGGPSFTNALHADHLHIAFDR